MAEREPVVRPSPSLRPIHIAPILVGILIAARASEPIRDNSFLWHIRAGALQLTDLQVLTTDPFSFTAFGEPWRTQSWLLELGYGWAESMWSSLAWANWMVFLAGITTFVLVGVVTYARSPAPIVVAAAGILGVWLFAPFAQPRPVIVSYVLLAAVAAALTRPEHLAWTLPGLFWVFAAVHGSWVLAGLLVILVAIRTRSRRVFVAGVASLITATLTAHGIAAWAIVVDFLSSQQALSLIQEWQPPDLTNIAQAPYLLVVALVVIGAARGTITKRDLVVVLPFLLYGLTSQRAVFPATIVVLPYAASAFPLPTPDRRSASSMLAIAAVVVVVVVTALPMFVRPLGVLDRDRFPDASVVAAVDGRTVFQDTAVGGYLIYADWPGNQVYVDDRAELYGFDRLDAFRRAQLGDYQDVFDRYGIDAAILEIDVPLVDVLTRVGWSEVARSSSHIALLAP